jgi:hypothetical protein
MKKVSMNRQDWMLKLKLVVWGLWTLLSQSIASALPLGDEPFLSLVSAPFLSEHRNINAIINNQTIIYKSDLKVYYDPPPGYNSPTALGVFVWSNYDNVKIYFELSSQEPSYPTLESDYAYTTEPYIEIDTPFKGSRNRTLTIVGVWNDGNGHIFRSDQHSIRYFVEASGRPYSYGYLIPGIESAGTFVQIALEVKATARAQAAGNQEFADFFTELGIGTYRDQVKSLNLLLIDPDLQGFEGGFPCMIIIYAQLLFVLSSCFHDFSQYNSWTLWFIDPLSQWKGISYCRAHT